MSEVFKGGTDGMKKNVFLIAGIVFVLFGLFLTGLSAYDLSTKEKVTAKVSVKHGHKNSRYAAVSYDYNGVAYTDKGLSSFNAFTMKDGKDMTILIDPEKPDEPTTTNWGLGVVFVLFGGVAVWVGVKKAGASASESDVDYSQGYHFKKN